MVVGNILPPILGQQVTAIKRTSRALDQLQLTLASGLRVRSALDNPQNFFNALSLNNRAVDLSRLLDGIGQSVRTIQIAESGIRAALKLLDQAEAYVNEVDTILRGGGALNVGTGTGLSAQINEVLAANPEAIHLGGGQIVHVYDTAGTVSFDVPDQVTEVEYLIVGGGGEGGSSTVFGSAGAGGGGGGGVISGTMSVSDATNYDVIVGAGGAGGAAGNNNGTNGGDSSFGLNAGTNLSALGGGGGVGGNGTGNAGGSGGGSRDFFSGTAAGLQPGTVQGGFGNAGGTTLGTPAGESGGGGGGAGSSGGNGSAAEGGFGGAGLSFDITGVSVAYGGGGGGGGANTDTGGAGGAGGGGTGGNDSVLATAGTDGLGSGGGGGNNNNLGADGGDGTVILRYQLTPFTQTELDYQRLIQQIDAISVDAQYRGLNLLSGEDLITTFNEKGSSRLVTEGIDVDVQGLGLSNIRMQSTADTQARLASIREARENLRRYGSSLSSDLSIIRTRQDFTRSTIATLKAGRDDLTVADQNEAGAQFLALQVRQQVQFSVLATAARLQSLIGTLVQRTALGR